jgi:heat shock protein HslJ
MHLRRPSWALATLLLGLASTGSTLPPPQGGAELAGTSWRLVKFQGSDDETLTPVDKAEYTVAFGSDGRVSVRIDCNRGHGTWKSAGPKQLEFGPLALTRAMCPPAPLNERIVRDWQNIRSYILKAGHLFLSLMADGGTYEFEAESRSTSSTAVSASLENTRWKLTHLGEVGVTPASAAQEAYIILDSGTHRVSGSGGCNRLTGHYELSGNHLRFSQMAGTMMACIQGMETEGAFLQGLGSVGAWKIAGQQLELLDSAGKLVARFEAADPVAEGGR